MANFEKDEGFGGLGWVVLIAFLVVAALAGLKVMRDSVQRPVTIETMQKEPSKPVEKPKLGDQATKEVNKKDKTVTTLWWDSDDYTLDCDNSGRGEFMSSCTYKFYAKNRGPNDPALEEQAIDRCRLASNIMYCVWKRND